MKYSKSLFLIVSMLMAMTAQAQSPLALTIEDFEVKAGETKAVSIAMQNTGYDVIAIEFKMQLPEGLTLASEPVLADERIGRYTDKFGSTKASGKTVNYDVSAAGYWIFSIFSMTDQVPFTGTDGIVLTMNIAADAGMAIGETAIRLYDIELSTKDAPYYPDAYSNTVSVYHENVAITMAHSRQTFSCAQPLDFTDTGLKAYIATDYQEEKATLVRVGSVPASTGLFLVGEEGETYTVPYAPSEETYSANLLKPVLTAQVVPQTEGDYTNYLYGEVGGVIGFHKSSGEGNVAAGKAFLQLPTSSGARYVGIALEDETTGIGSLLVTDGEVVYDLRGRKLSGGKLRKGVYIVNGKKAVVE